MALAVPTHPAADASIVSPPMQCVGCGLMQSPGRPALRRNGGTLPFDLHRCGGCGLVQQHPRESTAKLAAHYGHNYYVFKEDNARRWARAVQQYCIHLRGLERRSPKRLLDVGCALGHLAALAKRRGWRVTGIDVSAEAVSRAVSTFSIDALAGQLSQYLSVLPRFDVVFLGDVLEHVGDPARFLLNVHSCLAPNGVVCIDTPNWGGWWRRVARSRWIGINPFHVNLFDGRSLGAMLARCGMDVTRTTSYTHCRYAAPSARPELRGLIGAMPDALAWRTGALLDRMSRIGAWADLRTAPPTTLDTAAATADRLWRRGYRLHPSLLGDNLVVHAQKR
ncbi:MAG: class I SAM-dependent methyltransferase [Phycisphaerae bacterium]|nr:class I SAM-dependent methyltransferase [Phycisphaerae bacterium]